MRHILLLRGINLGASRRVAMPQLRAVLDEAGYGPVRTYVQSGNIVLRSDADPSQLEVDVAALIAQHFGLDVPIVSRSAEDLAAVLARDPLGAVATDPKRYQVSFCASVPGAEVIEQLAEAAMGEERLIAHGREIYAWHPDGVARSKLWNALAGPGLGTLATTRNWTTVRTLHTMAEELVP